MQTTRLPCSLKDRLLQMNADEALDVETKERKYLENIFGEALTAKRLGEMSRHKVRELCRDLDYLSTCCTIFMCKGEVNPQHKISLRDVILLLLHNHPDCDDLFEIIVSPLNLDTKGNQSSGLASNISKLD